MVFEPGFRGPFVVHPTLDCMYSRSLVVVIVCLINEFLDARGGQQALRPQSSPVLVFPQRVLEGIPGELERRGTEGLQGEERRESYISSRSRGQNCIDTIKENLFQLPRN